MFKAKKKNKQIQIYNKAYFKISTEKTKKNKKKFIDLNLTIDTNDTIDYNGENDLNEPFEDIFMKTARNKWRNNKKENLTIKKNEENKPKIKEKKIKNSEEKKTKNKNNETIYEVLELKDNLRIYKYSNIPRKNPHKLIYQYFFDKFNDNDYKNAKIILFIGKTGDGKSTAINAFFNIIKGIKLEDKHRFILIQEQKKPKGQAESQTDGLHFYYIKDYNNNPIIIIDSQGFGDTRGKKYDEYIIEAFEYAFKNIIKYINIICFIAKSTDSRLDILIKYIFSSITSLFSEDIAENLLFLTTHANRSTINEGSLFIESIKSDENFQSIIKNINTNKKWWYAVESVNILDNEIDRLTKYSYNQFIELFEENIKNSKAKKIEKSCEIINNRNKIKTIAKKIINGYHNLMEEKEKKSHIEKQINETEYKINDINNKIENKQFEIDQVYIIDKDSELSSIRNYRDRRINSLENEYDEENVRELEYVGGDHTYCRSCKRNCHEYCYCVGGFLGRCTIFPVFGNYCERCGDHKDYHTLHSSYKYVDKVNRTKRNNYYKIQEERDYYQKRYNEINDEYNSQINTKNKKENELNVFNEEKKGIENIKNNYINNKNNLNQNINSILNSMKVDLLEMVKISQKIKNIAMNQFHVDIENTYMDSLIDKLQLIGKFDNPEIKYLKECLKYNKIFQEINNMNEEEIIKLDENTICQKLQKLV